MYLVVNDRLDTVADLYSSFLGLFSETATCRVPVVVFGFASVCA